MHYQVADVLSRPKSFFGLVAHKGVVVGHDAVFHNTPLRGEHISSSREFADGKMVTIVRRHPNVASKQAILRRIRHQLAEPRAHHPTAYNCEHSVSRALGLPVQSEQLQTWVKVAGVLALALLASRA